MAWYWDILLGVGIFNLVFVFLAWFRTVLYDRGDAAWCEARNDTSTSRECILHFLQTMYIAERQNSR